MNVMRRILSIALGLLAVSVIPARAHEKGAIYLASKQVAVGGELTFTGERLPKNAVLRLELRGALKTFPLGTVRTDAKGVLAQSRLTLPPDVAAGSYRLAVISPDGDVTAQSDLAVAAAPAMGGMPMPPGASMPRMSGPMNGPRATAEMMELDRRTSPAEWAVVLGFVALTLAGGLLLLRKAAHLAAAERQQHLGHSTGD